MSLSISVVICAYSDERWEDLSAAVASVCGQTRPAAQIVLAIDHNPPLAARAGAAFPTATVVENAGGRGLATTRNVGAAAATGEIIAFLDDDALAAPDWLEQLVEPYMDPQVVAVGGAIDPLWLAGRPGWFPSEFDWVVGCTYTGMPRARREVRNLIGANMSFRRTTMQRAGGFRAGIGRVGDRPVGCEETELCIRITRDLPGARIIYEPLARVTHRVPPTRATWRYFRARCFAEGLSKALVVHWVGGSSGLATERSYTFRTLPRGALAGLRAALTRREWAGLGRAAAIAGGLAITTAGYAYGRVTTRFRH